MKKSVIILILHLFMITLLSTNYAYSAQNTQEIKVTLDGHYLQFDEKPTIVEERTIVPMRAIFESFGAKVHWHDKTKTVTGTKDNIKVTLQIDSRSAFVNDRLVMLDVTARIINGRTFVPIRFISESLGAKVGWDDTTKTVILKGSELPKGIQARAPTSTPVSTSTPTLMPTITSIPTSTSMTAITSTPTPTLTQISTLTPTPTSENPLGDISRPTNTTLPKITPTSTIRPTNIPSPKATPTSTKRPTNTPAPKATPTSTTRPVFTSTTKVISTPIPLPVATQNISGGIDSLIGASKELIIQRFGQPARKDLSKYGFYWYIYKSDYSKYIQIGIDEGGKVVGIYTNSKTFTLNSNISVGSAGSVVETSLNDPIDYIQKGNIRYRFDNTAEQKLYLVNDSYYATVFFDIHDNGQITSFLLIEKQTELSLKGYFGETSEELRKSFEAQTFDMVNAIRVRNGKTPFTNDESLAQVAREHSEDMALNNYFSHTNLSGQSPFDRMTDAGLKFSLAAENIAWGQPCAIYAHEGWMNSSGHRKNILGDCKSIGVGVYIGENGRVYYTQNFYTKR